MSASAIRRKSYKKAQEEAGPFSPVHWEADGGGGSGEVPAGKLQVMEKFFTPVQQTKEVRGASGLAVRGCRCHLPWKESRSDRFSTLSSSPISASSSSASWSSEASLDKEAFLLTSPRYHSQHSQSCVDISGEAGAFPRGQEESAAAYEVEEPAGFLARLQRGQSKSADRLPRHRRDHRELLPLPGPADDIDQHLYKATRLERSLVFNEETEILAPWLPHQIGVPAPSKGILKNGEVAGGDRLRKAKSIETITVRTAGRESRSAPGPGPMRPLQRERQPPNNLDLSTPKKSPVMERMKLMEEKLRFSEFLNEITWQVMSPSSLSSLGWKAPEAVSACKASSTDGLDSKGSSSKDSSPGPLPEAADGKAMDEMGAHGARRRPEQMDAKGDSATASRQPPKQARAAAVASTSPELGPFAPLPANLGSLSKLSREVGKEHRKPGESKGRLGMEGQDQPPKEAEKDTAGLAEKPNSKEQQEGVAMKVGTHIKELLAEMNTEQPRPPQEQEPTTSPAQKEEAHAKSRSAQRDLQKTWEELENLKEKFSRLQEDYSHTQITNQLLEEKLQIIAQSMAEERQTLNEHINLLLERLISAQNTICTLEKINISGLLSKSGIKHQHSEKAESPDSFCSLHILDVAPPPAFMDGASDAQTTPSQSDSATETSKLGGSSESDTAGPNRERPPRLEYNVPTTPAEGPKRHSKSYTRATAFTPWEQKSTRFSTDQVNSTESECSGEETTPICPLPTPRFLYLRQKALVAPSGPNSFPSLPVHEPVVFEMVRPPPPSSGQLELVPELSSSESSDDGEVSWSPGLVEKTSASHLDYESAQKMLDSLLHKGSEQEKNWEKESRMFGQRANHWHLGYKEGSGPGRILSQQHRICYYQDFPNPGEELQEGKSYPCSQLLVGSLQRDAKQAALGPEGSNAAQDSTSL